MMGIDLDSNSFFRENSEIFTLGQCFTFALAYQRVFKSTISFIYAERVYSHGVNICLDLNDDEFIDENKPLETVFVCIHCFIKMNGVGYDIDSTYNIDDYIEEKYKTGIDVKDPYYCIEEIDFSYGDENSFIQLVEKCGGSINTKLFAAAIRELENIT
jgi:hypothetical protein